MCPTDGRPSPTPASRRERRTAGAPAAGSAGRGPRPPHRWGVGPGAPARETTGGRLRVRFGETRPLPTYLFGFVAGRFSVERAMRNGRELRMLHRETDAAKVARNREALFDLHASALEWLEDYTALAYPFDKFDFILISSFQFGGMEHARVVLY